MRVVLAGGGTAGHIEPALNTADAFVRRYPDVQIRMVGTARGLETRLVPARGYRLVEIPAVPLPRKVNSDLVKMPPRLVAAVKASTHIVAKADVVVGFGGYVSLPLYLAAKRRGVPFVVHEANAKPGLANRIGARFTPFVAETVPGSLPHARAIGLPLRPAIARLDRNQHRREAADHFGLAPERSTILVFGGSQGAVHLNDVVSGARNRIVESGVQILHILGERNEVPTSSPGYRPMAYVDRMDLAYSIADLAVCRAGAMTCAELAAVGLPAIYVPLPIGNGEQRFNALPTVNAGGGRLVADSMFTSEWLIDVVDELMHDGEVLQKMGEAAAAHGVRNADERLVDLALEAMGES